MRPTRVQTVNLGACKDVDWTIQPGATAIVGANGSGKTTRLRAILLALYAKDGELAKWIRHGEDRVEVTVTVDHGDRLYRVRRAAGRKPILDFEIQQGDEWLPMSTGSNADKQKLIDDTFGLTRATFQASAYLGQGAGSFAQLTSAKQYELFSALIGLDKYDTLAKRAHDELARARVDLELAHATVARADEQLAALEPLERELAVLAEMVAEAEQTAATARETLEACMEQYRRADTLIAAVSTARAALTVAEAEHRRLAAITEAAETARVDLAKLGPRREMLAEHTAELPVLDARAQELQRAQDQHAATVRAHEAAVRAQGDAANRYTDLVQRADRLIEQAAVLEAKAVRALRTPGEPCDRCQRPLGNEDAQRAAESYRAEGQAAREQIITLNEEAAAIVIPVVGEDPVAPDPEPLKQARAAVETARNAERELAALNERAAGLDRTIAADTYDHALAAGRAGDAVTHARDALHDAETAAALIDPAAIQRAGLEARANVAQAEQTLTQRRTNHDRAHERHTQLAALQERTHADRAHAALLNKQAAVLQAAERAHGRAGIPALILENRVPAIEEAANGILQTLGGKTAGARIEIRTQRAKADGAVKDELQVVLVTSDGYDQPYDAWSGGEAMRINIALRWALADMTEIVILDEPAALDDQGKQDFRDLIDRILDRGVRTVLVVSHEAALQDSFDQVLHVSDDGTGSKVTGADVLEAAVA